MNLTLRLLSQMYKTIIKARNQLFDLGLLKQNRVLVPVVSVGNLTTGGVGKTPVIDSLIQWAQRSDIRVGVVSRGYKGGYKGVQQVADSPQLFGDEPVMLYHRHPNVPIFVGADRVKAAEQIILEKKVELILADDAFQHRYLNRDINILVVDLSARLKHYKLLPEGHLREPLEAVERADFVIFNKKNLVTPEKAEKVFELFRERLQKAAIPYAFGQFSLKQFKSSSGVAESLPEGSILLVSGIGNPDSFASLFDSKKIAGHMVFADHHTYEVQDIKKILSERTRLQARVVVTTEKDMTKLKNFLDLQEFCYFAEMEIKYSEEINWLYEKIISINS